MDVSEWRKIGSALNVADDATKWGSGPDINAGSRWFCGPKFLRQTEESWPGCDKQTDYTAEELIVCNVHYPEPEPETPQNYGVRASIC